MNRIPRESTPPPPPPAWGTTRYYWYYDPLKLEIDCGETHDRDSATAALLAAASELRRSRGPAVGAALSGLVFAGAAVGIGYFASSFARGAGFSGIFVLVTLFFAVIGLAVVGMSLRNIARYGRAAAILEELARMVEAGLVTPQEVCSKNVMTLLELYRLKRLSMLPKPPLSGKRRW